MAQINTTFGFKDQITQSLSLLNNTLTSMNKTLATMQGQMSGVNSGMSNVEKSAQKTADKVGGLSTKMLNFNMAVQAFHAIKGAIDSVSESVGEMSAAYNFQMTQENKLATVMRSRMKASEEQIQSVKNYASVLQSSGVIGDEVQLAGAQELATYISDVETLKTLMPVLNDIAVQASPDMNVNGQQMMNLATMLGKVMGGSLSGMSRRGWVFTEEEKKQFEAMNEQQRAKFLADYAQDAIGKQNENAAQTAAGQIIQLNNQIGDMKEQVGQAIIPLQQLYTIMTGNWRMRWYQTVINALNFVKTHSEEVIFVMGALATAIGVVGIAFLALKAPAVASAVASAVAWLAALGPIGLVIGAIVGLLGFFSLLFGAANTLGAVFGTVFGFISTVIGDTFKMAYNMAVPFINNFITMAEFFYNVWKHPIDAVKGLFYSFLETIIQVIGGASSVIDSILGTNLTAGINNLTRKLEEAKKNAVSDEYRSISRLELKQTDGIIQGTISGAKSGIDTAKKIESALKGMPENIRNGVADGFSFGSDGALKTADSSLVDIADDYKELLSARAREKFNLQFSQVTPEVNIGDVVVTGEADEDRLVSKIFDSIIDVCSSYTRESA